MNKKSEEEMKKLYPDLTDEECRDAINRLVDFFYQAAKILNKMEEEMIVMKVKINRTCVLCMLQVNFSFRILNTIKSNLIKIFN